VIPGRLFDTHCHLFEHGFHGRTGILLKGTGEELSVYERYRAEFGIERSLVVGYEEPDRYRGNSAYLDGLAASREWLVPLGFAAVGHPLPARRAVSAYVSTSDDGRWLGDALAAAAEPPAVVSLNARPDALAVLAASIREHDRTWFLVSHLGLPGPTGSRSAAEAALAPLLALAGSPNVSVKLSGQYAASLVGYPHPDVQGLVDLVADRFGVDALTWGSDFSPCLEHVTLEEAVECVLPTGSSPAESESIYFGNADRLFTHYLGAPV
jgi:hypothetical protein